MKKIMLLSALFFCLSANAQLSRPAFSRWSGDLIVTSAVFHDLPGTPIIVVETKVTTLPLHPFVDTVALQWEYASGVKKAENGVLFGWMYKNHQYHKDDVDRNGAWATWTYNNQQELISSAGITTTVSHIKTSVKEGKLVLTIYLSQSQVEYLKRAKALPEPGNSFAKTPDVMLYD